MVDACGGRHVGQHAYVWRRWALKLGAASIGARRRRPIRLAHLHEHARALLRHAHVARRYGLELVLVDGPELVPLLQRDVASGVHAQKGWGRSNYGLSKLAVIAATKVQAKYKAFNAMFDFLNVKSRAG